MHHIVGTTFLTAGLFLAAYGAVSAQMVGKVAVPIDQPAVPSTTATTTESSGNGDEALLQSVGIATDGPGLLRYFHLRTQGETKPERLAALIEQLGDKSPTVSRKACGELASLGAPAIPSLRQAVKDPDEQQTVRMVWQTGVNILPNGHVIIPATWMNRVIEYDAAGKSVWEITAMQPQSATRLRNGNALISPQMWPAKVIETDPSGKQVSEIAVPNFAYRIGTR